MDSVSWTGETGSYDPEKNESVFAEKSQTSPDTPVKFAFSLPCCIFYFLITLGVIISLIYALLCTFWFVVMVRDSRVDDVRKGEDSECTSFPDIFLAFFIMMAIFVPLCVFVAWIDPDSQCFTLMEFMKIIIAALWMAIMFWGVDEYFHIEPDCEIYIKEIGGNDFWLACQTFAYSMICTFVLIFLFCFCTIWQACEQSRIEREFRNSYYRQIHA